MMTDLINATGDFIEDVVRIADKHEADRDATLRKAVQLLQAFVVTASVREYEFEEELK